jgi:CcmD family protein
MNKMKYLFCGLLFLISQFAVAQDVPMADTLRSEGKIYVVVLIILIVLTGLISYLFFLDKKLNKMEKRIVEKQQTK